MKVEVVMYRNSRLVRVDIECGCGGQIMSEFATLDRDEAIARARRVAVDRGWRFTDETVECDGCLSTKGGEA